MKLTSRTFKNMQEFFLAIFMFSIMVLHLSAQEIEKVEFKQGGGYTFPEEMLYYNVRSAKGRTFDQKIIDEDVKRLFTTGNFEDVQVGKDKTPDGKVNVIFQLTSKPRIRDIILKGNEKYPYDKLKDFISLEKNGPLNDKELQETLTKIRGFYTDKGYNGATVKPETQNVGEGQVDIIFDINENLRKKVLSVSFIGNTAYSSWKLKDSIATQHSYLSWLFNMGLLNKEEIELDKERLRELYWEKGFLDFQVTSVDIKDDPEDAEYVNVTFNLSQGEPYTVQEVAIAGNTAIPTDEIIKDMRMKTDSVYDSVRVKRDMDTISELYYALGYTDFDCKVIRVPDFKTHTVNIEFRLTEGRPFTVRDLNISGNRNTKDIVIRREMAIHPGDPVDKNRIEASKARLMGMNYFEKVDIVSVATEDADQKDVDVKVEEKDTWKFSVGAGMSDTDSLVGMVEVSNINFDLFNPNNYFTGGGQRLDLKAQYGIERGDFTANFTEPWLFGIPLRLDVSGFYHDRKYEDWNQSEGGGSVFLTKRFLEFNSLSLGYTIEGVRIYDMDSDLSEIFQKEEGSSTVSKLTAEIARDTRDSLLEPTSGYLVSLLGEINTRVLGASDDYYRTEIKASHYYSFLDDALTLHSGLKIGQTDMIGSGKDLVPLYDRYFLGGGDTIRGFPYRSISPVDYNNDGYGGESMLLGSVELTHPIYKFIKGALFCDFGNVWEKAWDLDLSKLNVGVGYGLRIKIPYINAPVKLDLAYPIVNNQDGVSSKIRFHFNTGFSWSP